MRICSCCYNPVVYLDEMLDNFLTKVIHVHDILPTFKDEDWVHAIGVHVSHEHLEKLGMKYSALFGDEREKMWHLPDGRVILTGTGTGGVSRCKIMNGKLEIP